MKSIVKWGLLLVLVLWIVGKFSGSSSADNAVQYEFNANGEGGYSRTICDFKSKEEFDEFVTGLLNTGTPYKTKHYDNLPCEQH